MARLPFVQKDHIQKMKDSFGLKVTNPTDPMPSASYFHPGKKAEGGFDLTSTQKTNYSSILKQAQDSGGEQSFDIFKQINAHTYKSDPHQTIINAKNILGQEGQRFGFFDIETFGGLDGGEKYFSPTEIHFSMGKLTDDIDTWSEKTHIVKPVKSVADNINNLIDQVEQKVDSGMPTKLNSYEQRVITRLLRYSDAQITDKGEFQFAGDVFSKYVQGEQIRTFDKELVTRAREGLGFLEEKGTPAKQVAQDLQNFFKTEVDQKGTVLAGQNIGGFDMPALNKFMGTHLDSSYNLSPSNYLDTFELTNLYGSGYGMSKAMGTDDAFAKASMSTKGITTLEGLSDFLGVKGDFDTHMAESDVHRTIKVAQKMLGDDKFRGRLDAIVSGQADGFDLDTISKGDTLFSKRAIGAWGDTGPDAFKTRVVDGKETIVDSRFAVQSQAKFEYLGQFEADSGVGVKLKNLATDEISYLSSDDPAQIRNTIYDKFIHGDYLDEQEMDSWFDYARKDTARRKWGKIVEGTDTAPVDKMSRFLQAYDQESALKQQLTQVKNVGHNRADGIMQFLKENKIRSADDLNAVPGIGPKTIESIKKSNALSDNLFTDIHNFYKQDLPSIFTATSQKGDSFVMGNYPEYYQELKGRIGAERDVLKPLVERINKDYDLSQYEQGTEEWFAAKREKSKVFSRAYQNVMGDATETIDTPEFKSFGIETFDHKGSKSFVNLKQTGDLTSHLNIHASKVKAMHGPQAQRSFIAQVIDDAQNQLKRQADMSTKLRSIQKVGASHSAQKASNELINLFERNKDIIPDSFGVNQKIQSMKQDPHMAKQYIDDFYDNIIGGRIQQDRVDDLTGKLDFLKSQAMGTGAMDDGSPTQEPLNNIIRSFEDVMRDDLTAKDFAFKQGQRQVQSLSRDKSMHLSQEAIESGYLDAKSSISNIYHGSTFGGKNVIKQGHLKSGFDNKLKNTLQQLDENLNSLYKQQGFQKMPDGMTNKVSQLIDSLNANMDQGVGYNLYMHGGYQSPQLSIAMYDSKQQTMLDKSLSAMKADKGVAMIDVPLIGTDQYLHTGTQKKIASLAILDLADRKVGGEQLSPKHALSMSDVKVKSAAGAVIDDAFGLGSDARGLREISKLVAEGDAVQAEKKGKAKINQAISGLAGGKGATYHDEPAKLFARGGRADMMKKRAIMFDRIFQDPETGKWHEFDGTKAYSIEDQMDDFTKGGFKDLLKQIMGDSVSLSEHSTRGKHLTQGIMSGMDLREMRAFGYFLNPARANIEQAENIRTLTESAVEGYKGLDGVSFNPQTITQGEMDFRMLGGMRGDASMKYPGVTTGVKVTSDKEFLEGIKGSIMRAGDARDKELLKSPANIPSLWEDQMVVSREFADQYGAIVERQQTLEGEINLKSSVAKAIKSEDGTYTPDYREEIGTIGDRSIIKEQKAKRVLKSAQYDRKLDQTTLQWDEVYEGEAGKTKLMYGTEKGTVSAVLSKDAIADFAGKEGVHAIASASHQSHVAHGDVIQGLINQSMRNLNESDLKMQQKENHAKEMARMVDNIFGIKSTVVQSPYDANQVMLNLQDQMLGKKEIGGDQLSDIVPKLNNIMERAGTQKVDPSILDLEMRYAIQDENFHVLDFAGKGRGARFSISEVERMKAAGFDSSSRYLKERILEEGYAGKDYLYERGRSLHYLLDTEGVPEHMKDQINISKPGDIRDLKPLESKASPFTKKGLFTKEHLKGTIINPERQGEWLDFDREITIDVAGAEGRGTEKKTIKGMYLAKSSPDITDEGMLKRDSVDYYKHQIAKAIRSENDQELTIAAEGYFDATAKEVFAKDGAISRHVMGARLKGSGRGIMQITSPGLELTDDTVSRLKKQGVDQGLDVNIEDVAQKVKANYGEQMIEDPATVYLSETQASKMLEGHEQKAEIMESLKSKKGHVGHLARHPTIHPLSNLAVRAKTIDAKKAGISEDRIKTTASLANALFGDADGDSLSFAPVSKTDPGDMWKDVDRTRELLKSGELGGRDTAQFDTVRDWLESVDKETAQGGDIFDLMKEQSKSIRHMGKDLGTDINMQIMKSKVGNPLYTGMITNLAEEYRRIGRNVFESDEELQAFRSGIGQVIEAPISQKKLLGQMVTEDVSKRAKADVDLNEVVNILRGAGTEEGYHDIQQLGPDGMDLLTEPEVDAFQKVAKDRPEDFKSMTNKLHQSQKMIRENWAKSWRALHDVEDAVPSERREVFDKYYLEKIDEEMKSVLPEKRDQIAKSQAAKKQAIRTDSEIAASLKGAMGGLSEKAAMVPGGKLGLAAATFAGAAVGGSMANASSALPMDYSGQQGMQPRTQGTQDMVMGETNLENAHYGYEISVEGQTTMDRDPDELASLVNEAVQQTSEVPMKIHVNTSDNRSAIDRSFIEKTVARSFGG